MTLYVAGMEKCALAEFAGKVTCVVFLQGCNMKCSYCQNKDLVPLYNEKAMEVSVDYLTSEIPWDEIDALSISGGEPLWSALRTREGGADLMLLLMHARDLRKATNIDTNGDFSDEDKKVLLAHLAPYLTSISVDIKYGNPMYINEMATVLRRCELFSRARFRMVLHEGRWQPKRCIESGVAELLRNGIRKIKGVRNPMAAPMMTDEECQVMREQWAKLGMDLEVG